MCGITGWLDWERDLSGEGPLVEAMAQTLALRGPDDSGLWVTPRVALAHRRLFVIDPEGAAQPMTRSAGEHPYTLTFNGEIYNFRELRRELEALGHAFKTRSDTEVLLRAYMQWGPACVDRLNGMFAFGIWDGARQELFLARDHLGVKPLFYAVRGSAVLFGSEIKALLRHPLVKPEIDADGIAQMFAIGPVRTPGSGVYRDVKELRPGHLAICSRKGVDVRRYWKLESREHTGDLPATIERVREMLDEIVRRQMVTDMSVCSLLSGGLDSSVVTAIAAQDYQATRGLTLDTFTVDFVDDERHFRPDIMHRDRDPPWARRVADHCGTTHRPVRVTATDCLDNVFGPMRARDLPSAGEMETSLLVMLRQLKQAGATVVMSGEAADEVFGGHPWFYVPMIRHVPTFPWMPESLGIPLLSPEVERKVHAKEYLSDAYRDILNEVPALPGESAEDARTRELFYINQTHFLQYMLDRMDRICMAASLEVRVPFADHKLVEYLWNVPWEMKYAGGIEKGLLRRASAGLLPADVLARRKTAYPALHDPAYLEAIRRRALEVIDDASSPVHALLDAKTVRRLATEPAPVDHPYGAAMLKTRLDMVIQTDRWMHDYAITLRM